MNGVSTHLSNTAVVDCRTRERKGSTQWYRLYEIANLKIWKHGCVLIYWLREYFFRLSNRYF